VEFGDAALKDTSERWWMEDVLVKTDTNHIGRFSYAIGV